MLLADPRRYLDERIRLGQGSRGSIFVFTRGGPAEQAGGAAREPRTGCIVHGGGAAQLLPGWPAWDPAVRGTALPWLRS